MLPYSLLGGMAEKPLGALVPTQYSAVQIGSDDAIVRGFHNGRQERPHLFRLLAFGDVLRNADQLGCCSGLGWNRKRPRPDPPYLAIGPDDAIFDLRLAGRRGALKFPGHALQIFGVNGSDPRGWIGVDT